ncbi:MAG: nickel pincer cofactor biosynthesis protein LarB [Candidatus Hodarchaeota archaeon]
MNLRELLEAVAKGTISPNQALQHIQIKSMQILEGEVNFDLNREIRTGGRPEIVYAEYKDPQTCVTIANEVLSRKPFLIFSRTQPEHHLVLEENFSNKEQFTISSYRNSRLVVLKQKNYEPPAKNAKIGILTAGTSDIPIAKEAEIVLTAMGFQTLTFYDRGVAGLHRLFQPLAKITEEKACCLIVVAGMEGALPGVVAGLVDIPVIGVPTSLGYGLGKEGMGALTTMLQSCSPGLVAVNIDAGISAGLFAALIGEQVIRERKQHKNASEEKI